MKKDPVGRIKFDMKMLTRQSSKFQSKVKQREFIIIGWDNFARGGEEEYRGGRRERRNSNLFTR